MTQKIILVAIALTVMAFVGYNVSIHKGSLLTRGEGSITSYEECVAAGYSILESYPSRCSTPSGGSFVQDIGNGLEVKDMIVLDYPRPGDSISSPLVLRGRIRGSLTFEANFPGKILDENGVEIATFPVMVQGDWMTQEFVPFEWRAEFSIPSSVKKGTLVLTQDDPSGMNTSLIELKVPVLLTNEIYSGLDGQSVSGTVFDVYFGIRGDHEQSCDLVRPVKRAVPKTQAVAQAALQELLLGPTKSESQQYFTSINANVKLQNIKWVEGVIYADFSKELEEGVGGSCRVSAIRSQILETLKQFPTVTDVVISVDGRTEDILQP